MRRPIETLTIQQFRALREVTLEGIGGVNLLVGDNNSGKTSLLEAVTLYSEPMDSFVWRTVARRRVRGFETLWGWLFFKGERVRRPSSSAPPPALPRAPPPLTGAAASHATALVLHRQRDVSPSQRRVSSTR